MEKVYGDVEDIKSLMDNQALPGQGQSAMKAGVRHVSWYQYILLVTGTYPFDWLAKRRKSQILWKTRSLCRVVQDDQLLAECQFRLVVSE